MHPLSSHPPSPPPSAPSHYREDSAGPSIPPASVAVQPFPAFRPSSTSTTASSTVRRKPLPANASPVTGRFASVDFTPRPSYIQGAQRASRSVSVDTPSHSSKGDRSRDSVPAQLDRTSRGPIGAVNTSPPKYPGEYYNRSSRTATESTVASKTQYPLARHERNTSSYYQGQPSLREIDEDQQSYYSQGTHARSHTTSSTFSVPSEKYLSLSFKFDGVSDEPIEEYHSVQAPKPKSPASKFSSFFGWKPRQSSIEESDSPTTTFSGRSSPAQSPMFSRRNNEAAKPAPMALDIPKANSVAPTSYFNVPGTPLVSNSPGINAHVEELERELRHISSELAESIRREMELEDELDRIRADLPSATSTENRRTSDYYSDSGASSVRYPFSDNETKLDELEKLRRKAEQEKAQIKVDMAQRVQEELRRRRDLEAQVLTLEEQLQADGGKARSGNESDRVRELEAALEDTRRRLAEERQMKENFEDLLAALKLDLEQYRNERDNLHDEVVPQLRARVEGLEAQVSESEKLTYENARMQQEIQNLKNENAILSNARRLSSDLGQQAGRFKSIAEEGEEASAPSPRIGLSRSNSLARSSGFFQNRGRGGSLTRSNSVKDRPETQESLSQRVKDVEEQRDALHKALKNLLERQEVQAKEHNKRVKILETELARALDASPRRKAFHQEVQSLRSEINHLRRRADEALEQKYNCEKGLGGLRMDLDRAEQETSSLRELLKEHDIFVPERRSPNGSISIPAGRNLNRAFKELQTTHALSLARVKQMEAGDIDGGVDVERTLQLLKQSISDAEAERDAAMKEAEAYRKQARALQQSEMGHLAKEQNLSTELLASAQRMDELAAKTEQQLLNNRSLRQRLAEAIERGEEEQKRSAAQIVELEKRLKAEEEKVMLAQQRSEDAIAHHEDELQQIKESHNAQLQRARQGLLTPTIRSPGMPTSPLFIKSPRLDRTTSGPRQSIADATNTEFLKKKVMDLEKALTDADKEMQEVVGRMNMAQIEVFELQSEKDEAMRQTRKLQAEIEAERAKVKALMEQNPTAQA